jgi:hypothetical protein
MTLDGVLIILCTVTSVKDQDEQNYSFYIFTQIHYLNSGDRTLPL